MPRFFVLAGALALTLIVAGCSGPKGDKGDAGPPGQQGQNGQQGPAGKPGQNGKDGVSPPPQFRVVRSVRMGEWQSGHVLGGRSNSERYVFVEGGLGESSSENARGRRS
jgi:hypothetical protein